MATASKQSERPRTTRASKSRPKRRDGPSDEDVRILAYELFCRREAEGLSGDAISDWVEAEEKLAGRRVI